MSEKVFKVRMYGFGELASLYKPNVTKKSASNFLNRLIGADDELLGRLIKVKYKKGIKTLTPSMVSIVIEYLGEPF